MNMHIENPEAVGQPDQSPIVRIDGDVRETSRAFGLPVVADDGFNHAPECYWCDGRANSETCPRSVRLNEYVADLRRNDTD